ncbi:hypothetical protein AJ79_00792 [Helicocarpus griseus UAMH5409]|uniref:Uncharacterized protein n=1 Tax=Helicocarpus griseus UAMH5409 TaxID=1447875 RepID=A0A2B7YA30_9EURO|nr:hypothetical protein AJ79_00792 [Helicocarpus griseus UAMH5409]
MPNLGALSSNGQYVHSQNRLSSGHGGDRTRDLPSEMEQQLWRSGHTWSKHLEIHWCRGPLVGGPSCVLSLLAGCTTKPAISTWMDEPRKSGDASKTRWWGNLVPAVTTDTDSSPERVLVSLCQKEITSPDIPGPSIPPERKHLELCELLCRYLTSLDFYEFSLVSGNAEEKGHDIDIILIAQESSLFRPFPY